MTIRILVADDHPVVLVGIQGMIGRCSEFELVGEAVNGDEALRLTQELSPDVLVLDINMPGLKAIQVVRQIHQQQLPTRILIMTSYGDLGIVKAMMNAGATGYLLKDEEPSTIIGAVRAVSAGVVWFSPSLRDANRQDNEEGAGENLSEREVMVLQMVAQGLPNKEIARLSGIAERTVEFNITQLFHKLRVTSRVELALWAKANLIGGV